MVVCGAFFGGNTNFKERKLQCTRKSAGSLRLNGNFFPEQRFARIIRISHNKVWLYVRCIVIHWLMHNFYRPSKLDSSHKKGKMLK